MSKNKITRKIRLTLIAASIAILLLGLYCLSACAQQNFKSSSDDAKIEYSGLPHNDDYKLEQMTVLSRHDVRSATTSDTSYVTKVTPHKWFDWTSNPGELSKTGIQNETYFGQYFRQYLEQESMIPENWEPKDDEAFFYSNSIQRTIATAKLFSAAMIPMGNIDVIHKNEIGKNDNTFIVVPTHVTEAFKKQVDKEIDQLGGEKGRAGINENLQESLDTLENIIDFKDSEYAKQHNLEHIPNDPVVMKLEEGKEASHEGTVHWNNSIADALAFQYLEEPDDTKAGFGKKLSYDDMTKVANILTHYMKVSGATYTLAANAMHPMFEELHNAMNNPNRKFTFLCGHDITISAVLAGLKAKDFTLPNTFTQYAPIGAKLVFSKWTDDDGEKYCTIHYVYESTHQIRSRQTLDLDNAPVAYPIELEGCEKNEDGYYKLSDVENVFKQVLADYTKYQ